jgi:hypothetical protein
MHPYESGKSDMREQIISYLYEKYCFYKKWHGKEALVSQAIKELILDIREDQAVEQEKLNQTETASE